MFLKLFYDVTTMCDNKVQSEQIDTNGQFHMGSIQERENQIVSRLKRLGYHLDAEMFWVCDDDMQQDKRI